MLKNGVEPLIGDRRKLPKPIGRRAVGKGGAAVEKIKPVPGNHSEGKERPSLLPKEAIDPLVNDQQRDHRGDRDDPKKGDDPTAY